MLKNYTIKIIIAFFLTFPFSAFSQKKYQPKLNVELTEYFYGNFVRCGKEDYYTFYRKITYKADHIPSDKVRTYYDRYNMESECEMSYVDYGNEKNNKIIGEFKIWNRESILMRKGTYNENSVPIGKFEYFYPSGKVLEYIYYENGITKKKEGFFENGSKKSETILGAYENDIANATISEYYESGKIKSKFEGKYNIEGKKTGRLSKYYETGQLLSITDFVLDKLQGDCIEFYKTGIPQRVSYYENDELVGNKHYDIEEDGASGSIVYEEEFVNNASEWVFANATSSINSIDNTLKIDTDRNTSEAFIQTMLNSKSNFSIELTFEKNHYGLVGLYFGSKNNENGTLFRLGSFSFDINTKLEGIAIGTLFEFSSAPKMYKNTLKIIKTDNNYIFSINGILVATQKDLQLMGNKIGIRLEKNTTVTINRLLIKEFIDQQSIIDIISTKSAGQIQEQKEDDLNTIATGWKPLIDWQNQLFPSYIISTATTKIPKSILNDANYIGDPVSVLGIKVVSPSDNAIVKIEIKDAENRYFQNVSQEFTLPTKGVTYVVYPRVLWKYDLLRKQNTSTPIGITFKVLLDGKSNEKVVNIILKSINDCPLKTIDYNGRAGDLDYMFAAYVNEEHPMTDEILKEALQTKIVNSFHGYQGYRKENFEESLEDVDNQVFAIWRVLQNRGMKYSSITGGVQSEGGVFSQPVRLFEDAIRTSQANCIDGTVVFASILKKIGITTYIILPEDHAFLAYSRIDDPNRQLDFRDTKPRFLETTAIGYKDLSELKTDEEKDRISKISFYNALKLGDDYDIDMQRKIYSKGLSPYKYMKIDVEEARKIVKPLGR
jgi:antitoxin component YwqK of YwqJK toxin-antitoxin module